MADGSEIRSLSGRTAVLGDGISRNPIDRDEIMDQRGNDLQGYAGQIRGFDLDEFLSDWEDPGMPVPRTVGDHALPSPEEKTAVAPSGATLSTAVDPSGTTSSASAKFDSVFTALGCKHVVKVLFLPDYVATGTRLSEGGAIWRELQMLMPQHELRICTCVGPFVDDVGHAAFFDKSKIYVEKQMILDTKRDLLTSVKDLLGRAVSHMCVRGRHGAAHPHIPSSSSRS